MRKESLRSIQSIFCALIVILASASCASAPSGGAAKTSELQRRGERLDLLRDSLSDAAWSAPPDLGFYLDLYRMPTTGITAAVRRLERDGRRLYILRLTPPNFRGNALIVHGYMSHSGHFADLARTLTAQGYEVWMMDLPGFGLSDGSRNGIDDFHSYGNAVDEAVRAMAAEAATQPGGVEGRRTFDLPTVAVGHSTGCAALTDFALRYPADAAFIERLVLAAPLVRTTAWDLKRFTVKITGDKPFAFPRLPLVGKGTIMNPDFLRFIIDEDPLFFSIYDEGWIKAADRWDAFIGTGAPAAWKGRALFLQGDIDDMVDYAYNIPVLSRIFPRSELRTFSGYSHTLLNEAPDRLESVLREIVDFLKR